MAIEAVTAVSSTAVALEAQTLQSVTLGEMIDARLGGTNSDGIPGLSGAATITSAGASAIGSTATTTTGSPASAYVTGKGAGKPAVPAVLSAYGNGRIPREMMTLIGIGQHRLWGPAAESFKTMRAAAAADGVKLSVTDSYRPYDDQVDLARRKGLTKNGGLAAVPGTSNHGWGLAVDVDVDAKGLAWLKANGARFNWNMPTTREPWHWEYLGATS